MTARIIGIEPMSNTVQDLIPSIVLEGAAPQWNMPAVCRKDEQGNRPGCRREDKEAAAHFRVQNDDTLSGFRSLCRYISDQAVRASASAREVYVETGGCKSGKIRRKCSPMHRRNMTRQAWIGMHARPGI